MPRKIYRKKRIIRKRVFKRRTFPRKKISFPRPFPKVKFNSHRVCSELITYTPAAMTGSFFNHCNSFYDPLASDGKEQPDYFDEMALCYTRNKVMACRYKITFYNTTTDICELACCVRSAANLPTTFRECAQSGRYFALGATDENVPNKKVIRLTWNLKKMVGVHAADQDYSATYATNPSITHAFVFFLQSAANISVKYRVEMTEYVMHYSLQTHSADEN